MVKRTVFIPLSSFFLSLAPAVFLVAGEFTASVSNTEVPLTESFSLLLTLTDCSPKSAPSLSSLEKDFLIHSEEHSTSTTIINGKVSSSITWKLSLTPQIEGAIEIPPICVLTSEGLLSTSPISLQAVKSSTSSSGRDGNEISITTHVSNTAPYKNEPLLYKAVLTSKMSLHNVQAQKIQVKDAIVELVEEPKLEKKVIDGVLLNVVEFTYLITPLKTGALTISPMDIQGAVSEQRNGQYRDLDPFALLQGFERFKPFALKANEMNLDVQSALPEMSPWLPAKALALEEVWKNGQTLRVGEPFSRGVLIKAEGLKASQLPHLEDLQSQGSTCKVYADKPEEEEKVSQGILYSMRKEQFTLIPEQSGSLVLPEISIDWWDSVKKEKRTSTLPARTVQILPPLEMINYVAQSSSPDTTVLSSSDNKPFLLYTIMGGLTFLLAAALFWGFKMQRKIASLSHPSSTKPKPIKLPKAKPKKPKSLPAVVVKKEKKEKLPDLNPS